MRDLAHKALGELAAVINNVDEKSVAVACTAISAANKIAIVGCGREKLQLDGFAMRLFHLGLNVSPVGDVTTPPVGSGDLLIASAGPGELASVSAIMGRARESGASILFLTAVPDSPPAALADNVLIIPAQTMADDLDRSATTILPMGSAYEGAMFVLFEIVVTMLQEKLGISTVAMRANHTNLE